MNIHELIDNVMVRVGGMYGESVKFFNKNVASSTIRETIHSIQIPGLPDFSREGETELEAKWNETSIAARFMVTQWIGPGFPTIIFHHGSGDQPYFSRINKILPPYKETEWCNIIATDSPFNRTRKEYLEAAGDLQKFVLIFALSTRLIESVVCILRRMAVPAVVVSGISLGGWITNLHHTYFNSADEYRPIFAGAAPDDLFLESAYARLSSKLLVENAEKVKRILNFENDFSKQDNGRVYPLLGLFDRYIRFNRQKIVYRPENISTIEKGHITGTAGRAKLRDHLLAGVTASAASPRRGGAAPSPV